MNTLGNKIPMLEQAFSRDYVFLLDDLEPGMTKEQLTYITNLHRDGMELEEISERVQRDPHEVLIALIHQAKRGHVLPALRGKQHPSLLVPGREQLKREAKQRRLKRKAN